MKKKTTVLERVYLALFMILLYTPMVVLMVFSFNSSNSTSVMAGFSLKWYAELFKDGATIAAFRNTVVLAVVSAVISTLFGLVSAVGINYTRSRYYKRTLLTTNNIPMMNPDIVTGISMMLLFVFAGTLMHRQGVLGFGTMLIAHITFQLPYVICRRSAPASSPAPSWPSRCRSMTSSSRTSSAVRSSRPCRSASIR